MTPKKPAHTERQAMTFWSVFEAKHGLRQPEQPPLIDANGNPAEHPENTPKEGTPYVVTTPLPNPPKGHP